MVLVVFALSSAGCSLVNKIRAKNELNETARTYKEGHFEEAEQHARRALELDPGNKTAPIFLARVIHQQYKPGIDLPDNVKKATDAIEAYKHVLTLQPDSEEAYKAVSVLYAALKEDDKLRAWIAARATDSNLPDKKRSEAYAILAGKDWDCSFKITEANKETPTAGKTTVTYLKPKDAKEFEAANKCIVRGFEQANTAIKFDATNQQAWSYQSSLFIEQAKLAEMDGKADQKAAATKKAEEAGKRAATLAEEQSKREGAPTP